MFAIEFMIMTRRKQLNARKLNHFYPALAPKELGALFILREPRGNFSQLSTTDLLESTKYPSHARLEIGSYCFFPKGFTPKIFILYKLILFCTSRFKSSFWKVFSRRVSNGFGLTCPRLKDYRNKK